MTQPGKTAFACGFVALAFTVAAFGGELDIEFDATNFDTSTSITNVFWGLRLDSPGPAAYFSEADDGCEVSESEVVGTMGTGFFAEPYDIAVVVVRDREWVSEECDGEYLLVEDTLDWFAQDEDGNVWYLGEDTTAWDDEQDCLTDAGSWQAGDAAAEPGIVMLAAPWPGVSYRQEYLEDEAEDMALVLRLNAAVSIEYGDYDDCLVTKESTPLEPGHVEHKYYCPVAPGDPGLVLVEEHHGRTRRVEYVGPEKPAGTYPTTFPTSNVCAD